MKKKAGFFLFACTALFCSATIAQKYNTKQFSGGFGLGAGLISVNQPGDMKNGVYGDLRFAYHAGPGFITLSGSITGINGENADYKDSLQGYYGGGAIIPIKVGYKYFFQKHIFVMLDAGEGFYFINYRNGVGPTVNRRGTCFVYSPSVGAQFGEFEIGLKYESYPVPGVSISFTGIRLGLDF